MLIELTNGKKFLVKVTYKPHFIETRSTDEYGRVIYKSWEERDTMVFISEWYKDQPDAMLKFIGIAHCSYKDKFKRSTGRKIAYLKAIRKMRETNQITPEELIELSSYDMDANEYKVEKE